MHISPEARRAIQSKLLSCRPIVWYYTVEPPIDNLLPYTSKFPDTPEATLAFQKVSVAYNVLSTPSSKRLYDAHPATAAQAFSCDAGSPGAGACAEETLRSVVIGVFNDFLDGDLEMFRTLLRECFLPPSHSYIFTCGRHGMQICHEAY